MNAPIALFVYKRFEHTQLTIEALAQNGLAEQSDLFIFSDAPKNDNQVAEVAKVRHYLRTVKGFRAVEIIERERNYGLSKNITSGVKFLLEKYGKIIVLEDDLITSSYFLHFMNQALDKYADHPEVFSITGYSFTDDVKSIDTCYFLNFISTWGWGTWKRAWNDYSNDTSHLKMILADGKLRKKFSLNYSYDYISIARSQLKGTIDSWGIHWYVSVFLKSGLTLYPNIRLVQNIGFDGSGTHCGKGTEDGALRQFQFNLPDTISIDTSHQRIVEKILKKKSHMSFPISIAYKIYRKLFKR